MWLKQEMGKSFIVKDRGVFGPHPARGDVQAMRMLNRCLRWVVSGATGHSIEFEADPRHVDVLCAQLSLTSKSNVVATPGEKGKTPILEGPLLGSSDSALFKSAAMRCSFLAQDRPEIQFASKEVARCMASPTVSGMAALKRLVGFLNGHRRVVWVYLQQSFPRFLDAYSDTNHAGCMTTRRSTSMTCLMHGSHCIRTSSTTQVPVSLSTGESEYHGAVKSASALLGFKSLSEGFGHRGRLCRLFVDATAAKGIASRRGAGKIKHIATETLWLQRAVTEKRIEIHKVAGEINPPDMGTKHLASVLMWRLLGRLSIVERAGRADISLRTAGS